MEPHQWRPKQCASQSTGRKTLQPTRSAQLDHTFPLVVSPQQPGQGRGVRQTGPVAVSQSTDHGRPAWTRARRGHAPSSSMSEAIFRPRPYEEIYTEQAYLTASLRVQSDRVAELLRQYSLLEDELDTMSPSKRRRRARKQLNLVRSQLREAAEQEKAIFVRLSEVYMEVNSRDAWAQAGRQRVPYRGALGQPGDTGATQAYGSCRRKATDLNAATPEFVPRNQGIEQRAAGAPAVPEAGAARRPATSRSATWPNASDVDDADVDDADVDGTDSPGVVANSLDAADGDEDGDEDEAEDVDSDGDERQRHDGAFYRYKTVAGRARNRLGRENRLSLPDLESIWPK